MRIPYFLTIRSFSPLAECLIYHTRPFLPKNYADFIVGHLFTANYAIG